MERLICHQRKQAKKKKVKSAFVLADDCMYDKAFTKDTLVRGIFMNGRHWKVLFILTMVRGSTHSLQVVSSFSLSDETSFQTHTQAIRHGHPSGLAGEY